MLSKFECAQYGGNVWIDVTAVTGVRRDPDQMKDAEGKLIEAERTFVFCNADSYTVLGNADEVAARINAEREAFWDEQ